LEKIKAKSVVLNKFWILQRNNIKIGEAKLQADNKIDIVIYGNTEARFKSVRDMEASGMFEFSDSPPRLCTSKGVYGYPTDHNSFNRVWQVESGLPLFTHSADSKSCFAAGYYKVDFGGAVVIQFCPKLITLQRNKFEGPFKTKPELTNFKRMFE